MKRSYLIAGVLAIAAVAWFATGQLGGADSAKEGQKPAADLSAMDRIPTVRVKAQAAEQRTSEIVLRGRTEAWRKVVVKAETFGRIEAVGADKGDHVAAGDLVVQLAPEDRPARLSEAQALLAQRALEYEAASRLSKKGFRAETHVAANKAQLESAQASVRRAETELANTTIEAPIDGLVGERLVEVGDYVEIGNPVMKIMDMDPILAIGQISERSLARVTIGSMANVRLVTGQSAEGVISFVASEADPATRTFRIDVEIPNPTGAIADGITAEIRIPAERIFAHRISPAILTLTDGGDVGVKVLGAGNKVEFLAVHIIADEPDGLWVAGLPERVTFITVGQDFVTTGQTVEPVDEMTLAPFTADDPS
jgi:multidrug efflux system membrane fusion protein